MRANNTNLLQIQLTEAEKRHIKTLAASQGLTLRQATLQAFQAWELQLQSRSRTEGPAQATRAGAGLPLSGQPKGTPTPKQGRRQAEGAPPSTPSGSPVPNLGAASQAWLRRAAQLEWSKCPAAECLRGDAGSIWVVRGSSAPLAEILQSVADGHPVVEIAEVFEITLQQLVAILQFTAEGAASAAAGR